MGNKTLKLLIIILFPLYRHVVGWPSFKFCEYSLLAVYKETLHLRLVASVCLFVHSLVWFHFRL